MSPIEKVTIVGAGTMGLQISLITAAAGYTVWVYDISPEAIAKCRERHRMIIEKGYFQALLKNIDTENLLSTICYTGDMLEAVVEADLINESAPENLELKRYLHREFEKICPAHSILTTNTSSLLASRIDSVLEKPERFAAMHFHSGMTPLVDIMCGSKTSDTTVDVLSAFVRSLGLRPMIMQKEKAGYLFNTMLISHLLSALSLAARGFGTPHDIDRAWMMVTGMGYGPFGSMDAIGLDVSYEIAQNPDVTDFPDKTILLDYLKKYLDKGDLGEKSGQGFYSHPDPIYRQPGFLLGE